MIMGKFMRGFQWEEALMATGTVLIFGPWVPIGEPMSLAGRVMSGTVGLVLLLGGAWVRGVRREVEAKAGHRTTAYNCQWWIGDNAPVDRGSCPKCPPWAESVQTDRRQNPRR
jgi:hypothetical protein